MTLQPFVVTDNTKPETKTCKWCKGDGFVMRTVCPGYEKPVVCDDCRGRGTWEVEE